MEKTNEKSLTMDGLMIEINDFGKQAIFRDYEEMKNDENCKLKRLLR